MTLEHKGEFIKKQYFSRHILPHVILNITCLNYKPAVAVGQFFIEAGHAVLVADHVLGYFPETP